MLIIYLYCHCRISEVNALSTFRLKQFIGNLCQKYGASPVIWDHTVLPATWRRWRPGRLVLDLLTLEGWKAELTWVVGYINRCVHTCPKTITNPCTIWARRMATTLIGYNVLTTTAHCWALKWRVTCTCDVVVVCVCGSVTLRDVSLSCVYSLQSSWSANRRSTTSKKLCCRESAVHFIIDPISLVKTEGL